MNNWNTITLGDFYDFSSGLSKSADEFGFGFPFLSYSDVFWNFFVPEELNQLVNTSKKERESCSVKRGDIFLTRTSETAEELGMSCVALKDYPEATFNGFTKRLRPKNPDDIDPLFIGFYLRSPYFRAQVSAYSNIITRASLNNDILGRLKITIPSIDIQKKIGATLIQYHRLIENNNQRIKLLEEMAEEIYKEWFVRLRFPGYKNVKVVNGVPEGWERKKLGSRFSISLGGTPSRNNENYWNGTVPWINSGMVNELRIINASEYINELGLAKSATKLLPRKTTLLAITGATLGQVSLLEIDSCTNQSIVGIKDDANELDEFVFLTMKSKIKDLINYAGGGAQQHINKNIVEEYEILIGDDKIMSDFRKIIKPQFDLISNLLFKNSHLQQTRDLLLPRLISGKLSVENVEPLG